MYFLDQKSLQATVVKLYCQIKAQINLKGKKKKIKVELCTENEVSSPVWFEWSVRRMSTEVLGGRRGCV